MNGKKRLGVLVLAAGMALCAGCWDYTDLEDAAVIVGVAVDKAADGSFSLTAEIASPREETQDAYLIRAAGRTVAECMDGLGQRLESRAYWPSLEMVVLGQAAAGEGLTALIDIAKRDPGLRPTVRVAVSGEKDAASLLQADGLKDGMRSAEIAKLLDGGGPSEAALYKVSGALDGPGRCAALPLLGLASSDGRTAAAKSGMAVVGSGGLIGVLSETEAQTLARVRGQAKGGALTVGGGTTLEIKSSAAEVTPVMRGGRLGMDIFIRADAAVMQGTGAAGDTGQAAEDRLEESVSRLVKKLQTDFRADALGFGEAVRVKLPDTWRAVNSTWNTDIFPGLEVRVEADVRVVEGGLYKGIGRGDGE